MTPAPKTPTDLELDALLAEKAFGATVCRKGAACEGCDAEVLYNGDTLEWAPACVNNDLAALLALRDYCDTHSLIWSLEGPTSDDAINAGYRCSIMRWRDEEGDERVGSADAPTLPRAIVLALLRSAGVEVGGD